MLYVTECVGDDHDDCGEFGYCNFTASQCECIPGFTGPPCQGMYMYSAAKSMYLSKVIEASPTSCSAGIDLMHM